MAHRGLETLGVELTLGFKPGNDICVRGEQGFVYRARLVVFHTLQAGQQHLLEEFGLEIGNSELKQATSDGQRCSL